MKKFIFVSATSLMFFALNYSIVFGGEMGSGNGSSYPATLDTDYTIEFSTDYAREQVPNDSNAAIVKIENELGVNAKGIYLNVGTRLVDIQNSTGTLVKKSGDTMTGTLNVSSAVNVSGYTQLGGASPKIKMVTFSTNTATVQGGQTSVSHGLMLSKIISMNALVQRGDGLSMSPEYNASADNQFSFFVNATGCYITLKTGNSASILNKPVIFFIIYEE